MLFIFSIKITLIDFQKPQFIKFYCLSICSINENGSSNKIVREHKSSCKNNKKINDNDDYLIKSKLYI